MRRFGLPLHRHDGTAWCRPLRGTCMHNAKSILKTLGLALVLALLGGAIVVLLLRQNIDPRLYRFFETSPGRTVANIIGWSVDFELPPPDKPVSEMTEIERTTKRDLEAEIRALRPVHRLIMKSGEIMEGKVLSYTDETITFQETYGNSGALAAQIRRSRVSDLEVVSDPIPNITYRDVRIKMEFPEFEFHRAPPYTIITDESFFRVQHSVKVLRRLHDDFLKIFGPLVTRPERGDGIQLLFFLEEKRYRRYADRYAPQLENSSGFYSPKLDRLIVFNQITSDQLKEAKRELEQLESLYRDGAASREELDRLALWRSDVARNILGHAERQTVYTLRHEGAHQLLFTYGVHSTQHAENSWLIEGLAVYCEQERIGDLPRDRVALMKRGLRDATLIPLKELVGSRSARGLFVFGNEERVWMAYTQSWALVHFLMQHKFRDQFFAYIGQIRDPAFVEQLAATPRIEMIAAAIGLSPDQFERRFTTYIQRM